MSLMNKVKFFLGLPCIAKFGDQFVITKCEFGFIRVCLGRNEEYWWLESNWNRYCSFKTLAEAQKRFDIIIAPSQPIKLKLRPVGI